MSDHRTDQDGRKRLGYLLAHFVDHMDLHMKEIRERRDIVGMDGLLGAALDRSLLDMEKARASLAAALGELGDTHAHSHEHPHAGNLAGGKRSID